MRLSIYEVRQGDEIRRLAQRLLGDWRRWTELVRLNRLDPPYIADDPAPYMAQGLRVLGPGDRLLYPGGPAETPPPGPAQQDAEAEAYGRDLKLEGGYLVVQGGSLALVSGIENLRGALERRLNTPLGDLPAHPTTYGHVLRQYLGRAGGAEELRLVLLELERCIRQDPRVRAVRLVGELVDAKHVWTQAQIEPVPPGTVVTLELEVTP